MEKTIAKSHRQPPEPTTPAATTTLGAHALQKTGCFQDILQASVEKNKIFQRHVISLQQAVYCGLHGPGKAHNLELLQTCRAGSAMQATISRFWLSHSDLDKVAAT